MSDSVPVPMGVFNRVLESADKVTALAGEVHEIAGDLKDLREAVRRLDDVVRSGNGSPPLTQRVARLEEKAEGHVEEQKRTMTIWGGVVTTLSTALAALAAKLGGMPHGS
jgi:hypothetical protein